MNSDYRNVGCSGGSCPKQERCGRFLDKDSRSIQFTSPPFNRYGPDEVACNYYEKKKEEE